MRSNSLDAAQRICCGSLCRSSGRHNQGPADIMTTAGVGHLHRIACPELIRVSVSYPWTAPLDLV